MPRSIHSGHIGPAVASLALILALCPLQTQASDPERLAAASPRLFLSTELGSAAIRLSDEDFRVPNVVLTGGVRLWPWISLVGFVDTGIAANDSDGAELSLEPGGGVALRFESPLRNRLSGAVQIGAVAWTVRQDPGREDAIEEAFSGAMFGLSLEQALSRDLRVSAGYRLYRSDDPLYIDSWLLGLRWVSQ